MKLNLKLISLAIFKCKYEIAQVLALSCTALLLFLAIVFFFIVFVGNSTVFGLSLSILIDYFSLLHMRQRHVCEGHDIGGTVISIFSGNSYFLENFP